MRKYTINSILKNVLFGKLRNEKYSKLGDI